MVQIWDTGDAYTITGVAGTHETPDDSTDLYDSDAGWTIDALIGYKVTNTTDSNSYCTVTDNTATTVICSLIGGDGDWDIDDAYTLVDDPGTHDGAENAATLQDLNAGWTIDALIGDTVTNTTKSESCIITDNTATTITCTLSGGGDWDYEDAYNVSAAGEGHTGVVIDGKVTIGGKTTIGGE